MLRVWGSILDDRKPFSSALGVSYGLDAHRSTRGISDESLPSGIRANIIAVIDRKEAIVLREGAKGLRSDSTLLYEGRMDLA